MRSSDVTLTYKNRNSSWKCGLWTTFQFASFYSLNNTPTRLTETLIRNTFGQQPKKHTCSELWHNPFRKHTHANMISKKRQEHTRACDKFINPLLLEESTQPQVLRPAVVQQARLEHAHYPMGKHACTNTHTHTYTHNFKDVCTHRFISENIHMHVTNKTKLTHTHTHTQRREWERERERTQRELTTSGRSACRHTNYTPHCSNVVT